MKETKFNSQSGVSLVELLIVLVITIILVSFAVAQLGQSKTNLQRQNIARELKVSLERARFDSVKRRAANAAEMARVTIDSTTSFSVSTDLNRNGTIDASDTRQISFGSGDVRIVGSIPTTISFDRRGQIIVTSSSGANTTPSFIICNNCDAKTATPQNSNIIWISPTGTVSMTAGGEKQPAFDPPANLTNVSNTANINPKVSISQSNYKYPY